MDHSRRYFLHESNLSDPISMPPRFPHERARALCRKHLLELDALSLLSPSLLYLRDLKASATQSQPGQVSAFCVPNLGSNRRVDWRLELVSCE